MEVQEFVNKFATVCVFTCVSMFIWCPTLGCIFGVFFYLESIFLFLFFSLFLLVVASMTFYCYCMAMFGDAGQVPEDWKPREEGNSKLQSFEFEFVLKKAKKMLQLWRSFPSASKTTAN